MGVHLYPGAYHGFEILNPSSEIEKNAKNEYVQAFKKAFQPQLESDEFFVHCAFLFPV